jgi:predicted nucleic acid-binding protein
VKRLVADSSPLIVLALSRLLEVLCEVAGEIVVPATVFDECTHHRHKPGALALSSAESVGLLTVHPDADASLLDDVFALDAGEKAALALARQLRQPVLMDERLGRQVAALHKIPVIGSAGVLLAAKRRGLIPAVQPILAQWQTHGYFLAPSLLTAVLTRAGESSAS